MICENYFCVYNKDDKCMFDDDVTLDVTGMCLDCIYPTIDQDVIDKAKERFFNGEYN